MTKPRFTAYEDRYTSAIFDERGKAVHVYNNSDYSLTNTWPFLRDKGIDKTLRQVKNSREVTRLEMRLRGIV